MSGDRLLRGDGNEAVRPDDPVRRERLKGWARVRRRFSDLRRQVVLRRERHAVNHRRLFRFGREEQLHLRRRGGRKRAIGTRTPMALPQLPKLGWSLDCVSERRTDGCRFRTMTVVDDRTRECRALIAHGQAHQPDATRHTGLTQARVSALALLPLSIPPPSSDRFSARPR